MTLPPLAPGKIPAFHTLGDDLFEDLCRELVQEEDNVQTAERYGAAVSAKKASIFSSSTATARKRPVNAKAMSIAARS